MDSMRDEYNRLGRRLDGINWTPDQITQHVAQLFSNSVKDTQQSWQYDPAGEFWRLGLAKLKVFSRSSNIMLQLFSFIYIIFKSIISGTQVH